MFFAFWSLVWVWILECFLRVQTYVCYDCGPVQGPNLWSAWGDRCFQSQNGDNNRMVPSFCSHTVAQWENHCWDEYDKRCPDLDKTKVPYYAAAIFEFERTFQKVLWDTIICQQVLSWKCPRSRIWNQSLSSRITCLPAHVYQYLMLLLRKCFQISRVYWQKASAHNSQPRAHFQN